MGGKTTIPKVICFSGSIASGKSSLIKRITEILGETAVIRFDDYDQYTEYPKNIPNWINDGIDASLIKNYRMLTDIQKLIARESIVNPLTQEKIYPTDYVFVEDPIGTLREEFAKLYDFLIFIEIPPDISLARLIKRMINEATINGGDNLEKIVDKDLKILIKRISNFLNIYLDYQRILYQVVCDKLKPSANLRLDGQKSPDELANDVIIKIKEL